MTTKEQLQAAEDELIKLIEKQEGKSSISSRDYLRTCQLFNLIDMLRLQQLFTLHKQLN